MAMCAPVATPTCSAAGGHGNVFQLDAARCVVYFDGSETAGSTSVDVFVTDPTTTLTRFAPILSIATAVSFSLSTDTTQLSPVSGWLEGSGCGQQYQRTKVTTTVGVATAGVTPALFYDVSSRVASMVSVTPSTVAAIDTREDRGAPRVVGVGAGLAVLTLVGANGSTLATSNLTVVSSNVTVSCGWHKWGS